MFGSRLWWRAGVALAVASAALTGCSTPSTPTTGKPQIVASMYPFAFLASAIAGDAADVVTLVPPGTEPHDYELTPSQRGLLSQATLVVYQEGINAAVDAAIAQAAPEHVVETGSLVTLLRAADDGADTGGETHSDYAFDPHTWLDPRNMVTFANALADALAAADPGNAAGYEANAAALTAQLTGLDAEFRTGLTGCRHSTFITTHAAFGYMAKAYDLTQLAITGVTPDDEPSPMRLAELATKARNLDLTTVFFETLISPAYADTLAYDLGLRTDVLDPLESVTSASRGTDYVSIMTSNLTALRQANGCP